MRSVAEQAAVGEPSEQTRKTFLAAAGTAYEHQLMYAQEIGLGTRQYELVRIGE